MATVHKLSPALCRTNKDKLYVFGDNLLGKGKAGQACIRDEPNAFGIPTKRFPSMMEGSFFSDQKEEFEAVRDSLDQLDIRAKGKTVVIPSMGIGTGLAQLKERSPLIFAYIQNRLEKYL